MKIEILSAAEGTKVQADYYKRAGLAVCSLYFWMDTDNFYYVGRSSCTPFDRDTDKKLFELRNEFEVLVCRGDDYEHPLCVVRWTGETDDEDKLIAVQEFSHIHRDGVEFVFIPYAPHTDFQYVREGLDGISEAKAGGGFDKGQEGSGEGNPGGDGPAGQ